MMDNKNLLRAMGDIDDKFITEILDEDKSTANGNVKNAAPKKKNKNTVIRFMTYAIPAAAAVLIVFAVFRSGMNLATSKSESATAPAESASYDAAAVMADSDEKDKEARDAGADYSANSAEPQAMEEAATTSGEIDMETDSVQIANPFIDCDDLAQASKIAGFEFEVPDDLIPGAGRMINAVESDMIQVIYFEGEAYDPDKEILRIRKASGSRDRSGDYGEYPYKDSLDISGYEVIVMGYSENEIMTAMWQYDGFTYALLAGSEAVETHTLTEIVNAVTD